MLENIVRGPSAGSAPICMFCIQVMLRKIARLLEGANQTEAAQSPARAGAKFSRPRM